MALPEIGTKDVLMAKHLPYYGVDGLEFYWREASIL
jgi:hypothetical protein